MCILPYKPYLQKVIALVLSSISASLGEEVPCPAEGCKNITIYLGPRFGSKTLRVPNYPKTKGPSDGEAKKVNVSRTFDVNGFVEGAVGVPLEAIVQSGHYGLEASRGTGSPEPRHRPIPDDDSVVVDDMDVEEFRQRNEATRWQSYSSPSALREGVTLNFAGLDLGETEVREALARLTDEDGKRLRRLYLGSNNIQYLEPLTFPVALEYSLQELWLDHNPLTHLTSYTRFEISRLGNLKVLNLSSTGMSYLESPYLPALEVLDLSHNQMSFLPNSISSRLNSLRVLDLSFNRLHGVYDSDFSGLVNLQVLNLSNNNIAYLSSDAFKKMYVLNNLYLNNNSLTTLSHVRFPPSARVYLNHNPLECSCPLLALYQQTWPGIGDKYNLKCLEYGSWQQVGRLQMWDVHVECEPRWILVQARRLGRLWSVYPPLGNRLTTLYWGAIWSFLILALVLIVLKVRRIRAHREVLYDILDEKIARTT